MAESHVISGLKAKQEEIKKRISKLKREIKENQAELAAVSKTLLIFGEKPRAGWNRFFRRGAKYPRPSSAFSGPLVRP